MINAREGLLSKAALSFVHKYPNIAKTLEEAAKQPTSKPVPEIPGNPKMVVNSQGHVQMLLPGI